MSAPILAIENLSIDIPTSAGLLHAGKNISYEVYPGETFAIVGESGAGKSLSSLCVMGIQTRKARVSADRMEFDGIDLRTLQGRPRAALNGARIAMIFQDPMTSLNPVYTIGDQLAEVYVQHGRGSYADGLKRGKELLARVGVSNAEVRLSQYPHQLSGGLRQRVVIAMAMMCQPDLIIADEPTTALDVTIQKLILQLLKDLQQEFGMAMILITHDLGVVASVADRVAVMLHGKIIEQGSVHKIFEVPTHEYTKDLIDIAKRLRL